MADVSEASKFTLPEHPPSIDFVFFSMCTVLSPMNIALKWFVMDGVRLMTSNGIAFSLFNVVIWVVFE